MKDTADVSTPNLTIDPPVLPRAKANSEDFIKIQARVVNDEGATLDKQRVLFSLSGPHATFQEVATQKFVGTTDASGTVTVHLKSNDLEKGTLTVTVIDDADKPQTLPILRDYEFIEDLALGIGCAIETDGAKADGFEQNCVAIKLKKSGQGLPFSQVNASVDGKTVFVTTGNNQAQASTDSSGVARFYLINGNHFPEDVRVSACYEEAQWLQTGGALTFALADSYEISAEALSDFNLPGTSPNSVRIKLLINQQIAADFEVVCTLPPTSGAIFVANGKKELTGKTDKSGYLTVEIKNTKVEKVRMEAHVAPQPHKMTYVDLEWQKYSVELSVDPNNSASDGIDQNIIIATIKNDGVPVTIEEVIFKIDERSQSRFVDTGEKTLNRITGAGGTVSAAIVSNSSENYPVTVALSRFPTLQASINCVFAERVLTVLQIRNDANGDGKDENWVKVSLTVGSKAASGKKLFCEMKNKNAIFTSNNQHTSEVTTDPGGEAVIHMVGSGSFKDTLSISVEDATSEFKEVVLNWRKYTITQTNPNQKFIVGTGGVVIVEIKDNGTPVEGVDVAFLPPFYITERTDSHGKVDAWISYDTPKKLRAPVYLTNVPSMVVPVNIEFVAGYSIAISMIWNPEGGRPGLFKFEIRDAGTGGPIEDRTVVEASLTRGKWVLLAESADASQGWVEFPVGLLGEGPPQTITLYIDKINIGGGTM